MATATVSVPGIAGIRIVHHPLPGQSLEVRYVQGNWPEGDDSEEPITVVHRVGSVPSSSIRDTLRVEPGTQYGELPDGRLVVRFEAVPGHAPAQTLVSIRPGFEYEMLYETEPMGLVYQHARDRTLYTIALAERRRGLLIHATGFAIDDSVGVLCPGVSGTGKSTLCRLLATQSVTLLSDDRVVLTRDEGEFRIWGSPWCGDAHITNPASAELRVVALIRHAHDVSVRAITPREAIHRLWNTATQPLWSAPLTEWALALVDDLVAKVAVVEMAYPAAPDAAAPLVEQLSRSAA